MFDKESESREGAEKKRQEQASEDGDLENLPAELEELPPQLKKVVQATLSMQRIFYTFCIADYREN